MTERLIEKLAAFGIDYDDALDRFAGNAALYQRLALKYLDDPHYAALIAAMDVGDFEEGYAHAHSLKGVAGNLSFAELHKTASCVSDALRQGEAAVAQEALPAVTSAQGRVVEALEKMQANAL